MPTKVVIELCALCGADLKTTGRHGVGVQVIESEGGWGHRSDVVDFSDELCRPCGKAGVAAMAKAWKDFCADRKLAVVLTDNPAVQ